MATPNERRAAPRKAGTPSEDKTAARKRGAKPSGAPNQDVQAPNQDVQPLPQPDTDEMRQLIAQTAYFKAKERGFTPGYELEDWVQAEAEIRRRMDRSTS